MKYDTLIISGGSVKGYAILGSFKYLFDNNIIKYSNLKHIIGASVGALMSLPILLKIDTNIISKIMLNTDIKLYNEEQFTIKNLFNNYGIYENCEIEKYVKIFCKYFLKKENITLKELFKKTNIKFTVKVSNVTKNSIEYINHLNYPNLDLVTLIKMTTSIPIFFKPVIYNNNIYCDGANGGGLPIEYNKSKYYLGIYLSIFIDKKKVNNIVDYINNIYRIYSSENDILMYKKMKNIIFIDLNEPLKIDINKKEKEKYYYEGYKQTKLFFNE